MSRTQSYSGFLCRTIHHRGTEFAKLGEFLVKNSLTRCPRRLRGAISDSASQGNLKNPKKFQGGNHYEKNRSYVFWLIQHVV